MDFNSRDSETGPNWGQTQQYKQSQQQEKSLGRDNKKFKP